MVEIAVARLRALWPQAMIEIFSDTPELVSFDASKGGPVRFLPSAIRKQWFEEGFLSLYLHRRTRIGVTMPRAERWVRRYRPEIVGDIKRLRNKLTGQKENYENHFVRALQAADLLVVTGMGGVTDVFPAYATQLLESLDLAMRFGKTTAMFSQGIGPINDPTIMARAREVLPRVDLICLRESRASGPLLASLGVAPEKVLTTGDDAIEKAFDESSGVLGGGLGVNVRSASYSGVDQTYAERLRATLVRFAIARNAPIVAVPTSRHPGEDDSVNLGHIFDGCSDYISDYGDTVNTLEALVKQLARCRLLVTGSYHAGVFALSRGVPVIGLVNSNYYSDKFLGLHSQFGEGVQALSLQNPEWPTQLHQTAVRMWDLADRTKPDLIASARFQIGLSQSAYQRLYEIVKLKQTQQGARHDIEAR